VYVCYVGAEICMFVSYGGAVRCVGANSWSPVLDALESLAQGPVMAAVSHGSSHNNEVSFTCMQSSKVI